MACECKSPCILIMPGVSSRADLLKLAPRIYLNSLSSTNTCPPILNASAFTFTRLCLGCKQRHLYRLFTSQDTQSDEKYI